MRYNERKAQTFEVFANHDGPLSPTEWAVRMRVPSKWAYWYLKRLWLFGYLHRKRDWHGRIVYRLSKKGASWHLKFETEPGFKRHVLRQDQTTKIKIVLRKRETLVNEAARAAGPLVKIERRNQIIGIAGRKGSGKSTEARKILKHCRRLFLFDTAGEHGWIPERFEQLDEALIFLLETPEHDEFMGSLTPGDDLEEEFSECCDEVYQQGNMLFAIEEVPMLSTAQHLPGKLNKIVRLGRHRKISLLYTAQRLSECPRSLTAATDMFVLFCHTEPRDLDAIADRCGRAVAHKVRDLGDHGFLVWDVLKRQAVPSDGGWYRQILLTTGSSENTEGR